MTRLPVREHLRALYAELMSASGAVGRSRRTLKNRALVLMYHRVLHDQEIPASIDPGMYVSRSAFDRHLHYLADHHDVINLDDLLEWMTGRRQYSRPPCVITFDDGWADNYHVAFPLLRHYRLPATIFLVTDKIGTTDTVTWPQIHEMDAAGISFGSHTATHPVLTAIDDAAVLDELTRSKQRIEQEFDRPCRWFCYPKGQFDQRSLGAARALYTGAVSTIESTVTPGDDLHQIHRIGVHHDVSRTTALFACRLTSLV
jgi:peptidoglycan/xylan/chitin deacetylase (PgdA/CDA1 family)